MKYLNHIISFDDNSGILVVETGILLNDIINTFAKAGFHNSGSKRIYRRFDCR